jgi:hypothetical protein
MRSPARLILAHVLASFTLQAFLLGWMVATGEKFGLVRAAFAITLSPIFIPVVLLGLGHRMRPVGRILFWLLYIAMLAGSILLLRWRAARVAKQRRAVGQADDDFMPARNQPATPDKRERL